MKKIIALSLLVLTGTGAYAATSGLEKRQLDGMVCCAEMAKIQDAQ